MRSSFRSGLIVIFSFHYTLQEQGSAGFSGLEQFQMGKAIKSEQFRNRIMEISRQSRAMVINIQVSEADALLEPLLHGYPVHTEIAIFTPCIDLKGNLKVSVRMNKSILSRLNAPGAFQGKVINRRNIGKSPQETITQWREQNPDFVEGQSAGCEQEGSERIT